MAKTKAAAITNAQYVDMIAARSATFASHTANLTSKLLTERGFTELAAADPQAIVDFFGIPLRAVLQIVNIARAKDPLSNAGVGESFTTAYGGYIQRLATEQVDPVDPAYVKLIDGQSVDQQKVRKPKTKSRFFRQNFDYQSALTLQEAYLRQAFTSEYGIDEYLAGIMAGLEAGYIKQKYLNKLELIHQGLIDAQLKDTQKMPVNFTDPKDKTQMENLLYEIMHLMELMDSQSSSGAYNAAGFDSTQDRSRLVMLVRPGFKAAMKVYTLTGAFHKEELALDIPIVTVENFGGITYTNASGAPLYPVYSADWGNMIGYSTTEGATSVEVQKDDPTIKRVDPHANIPFIIMDKGWMFETIVNPYTVRIAPYNARGLYLNYFPEAHGNFIDYDRYYNFIAGVNQAA